jgi:hypothetical protein
LVVHADPARLERAGSLNPEKARLELHARPQQVPDTEAQDGDHAKRHDDKDASAHFHSRHLGELRSETHRSPRTRRRHTDVPRTEQEQKAGVAGLERFGPGRKL